MSTTCQRPACGHPQDEHSGLAGCLFTDGTAYCACTRFVPGWPTIQDVPLEPTPAEREEGQRLADEGAQRAYDAEHDEWKGQAAWALDSLISRGEPFTAEDLRALVGSPAHPNAMGAVFRTAAKQGRIQADGFVNAGRSDAHARALRRWVPSA